MKNTTRFPFVSLLLLVVAALTVSSCGSFVCNPVSGSGTGTGAAILHPVSQNGDGNKSAAMHPLLNPSSTQTTCSTGGGGNKCSSTDTPTQVMYSVDSTGAILAYGIDSTGNLTLLCTTAKAAVGELVVSNNKFLYVLNETPVAPSTQPSIIGFIIGHGNTGTVTSNGQSFTFGKAGEILDDKTHIEADPSGHLLFVTNFTQGFIHVFLVNQGAGTLTEATGSPFTIVTNPDFLAVSSDGKFAYVPDDVTAQIHVFSLNAVSGAMTETLNSPFTDDGGLANPGRFIAIHPNGKFLFTSNFSQISAYSVNTVTGDLGAVPGSPFDTPATMFPSFFAIDSTGKFLYVIDGNDPGIGIAGFPIDSTGTGALQGQVPGSPFALSITNVIVSNPLGAQVYVLGGNTAGNLINIYGITIATGALVAPTSATLTAGSNLVIANVQ
jgi:6-phosphogluconolactonase (cycloisomerase 2 family)